MKNVNGTPTASRFLRKSRARLGHNKIFGAKRGSEQHKRRLGGRRFSGLNEDFQDLLAKTIVFVVRGEIATS